MSPKKFWCWFGLIIVLAIGLRFWALGQVPTGLYWDEAAILADAKKVLQTGTDLHGLSPWHLIYPSYGDYKLAPYIWSTIISAKFFGITSFALRLPSAIAGILAVIIAGLLARILMPKKIAPLTQLATMLIVAIVPWSILFSRTGFEGHLAQMLLAASALALVAALRRPQLAPPAKIALLLASGFLGGLATWTYFSVRFVFPVVVGLILLYFFLPKCRLLSLLLPLVCTMVTFGFMVTVMTQTPFYTESDALRLSTPSILNDHELPAKVTAQRELAGNSWWARLLFTQKGTQASWLLQNVAAHLNPKFLFLTGDANWRHSTTTSGLYYLILAPFLLVGILNLWHHDKPLTLILLGWWLVALVPASVPTTNLPHALRSLNALVPSSLLIAYGLASFFTHQPKNRWWQGAKLLVVLGLVGSLAHFTWYYHVVYPQLSAADWQTESLRHGQLLAKHALTADRVFTKNLGQLTFLWYFIQPEVDLTKLPASTNFSWDRFEPVMFNTFPESAEIVHPNYYLLGPKQELLEYLREQQINYHISEDYQEGEHEYLGVITD